MSLDQIAGIAHQPDGPAAGVVVLTHGAGGNRDSPLLQQTCDDWARRDWLAVRYNDTENNVALWEFHNGVRRNMRFSDRAKKFMLDRAAWHELKLTIDGANLKTTLDGETALEYTLGSMPGPGRNNAPPNPDLIPANNSVLQPPVKGKIGLWAKTDTTSYFKDYVVSPK